MVALAQQVLPEAAAHIQANRSKQSLRRLFRQRPAQQTGRSALIPTAALQVQYCATVSVGVLWSFPLCAVRAWCMIGPQANA